MSPSTLDAPDLPDDEIELRYRLALAEARRTLHVDAWAQRSTIPLGTRCEDYAPTRDELPSNTEVFPERVEAKRASYQRGLRRKRRAPNKEFVRGVHVSRCYGNRAPSRMVQSA